MSFSLFLTLSVCINLYIKIAKHCSYLTFEAIAFSVTHTLSYDINICNFSSLGSYNKSAHTHTEYRICCRLHYIYLYRCMYTNNEAIFNFILQCTRLNNGPRLKMIQYISTLKNGRVRVTARQREKPHKVWWRCVRSVCIVFR